MEIGMFMSKLMLTDLMQEMVASSHLS